MKRLQTEQQLSEENCSFESRAVTYLQLQVEAQSEQLKEIAETTFNSVDSVISRWRNAWIWRDVLKRQNLRIAGVREEMENGQNTRDSVAPLLKNILDLTEPLVVDWPHRAPHTRR